MSSIMRFAIGGILLLAFAPALLATVAGSAGVLLMLLAALIAGLAIGSRSRRRRSWRDEYRPRDPRWRQW